MKEKGEKKLMTLEMLLQCEKKKKNIHKIKILLREKEEEEEEKKKKRKHLFECSKVSEEDIFICKFISCQ